MPNTPLPLKASQRALGQFFTPPRLARFVADFFVRPLSEWRVIDAGAGAGALTLALVEKVLEQEPRPISFHVTAYELDRVAIARLRETLQVCALRCGAHGVVFEADIRNRDFIADTTSALRGDSAGPALQTFNAAIVNPPYRKLRADSPTARQLRRAGIEVPNLYSAFLALLGRVLEQEAEMVAIVPRSFCNGPYSRAFRRDFLAHLALQRLHVFESRKAAFARDEVLQENIVFRAERRNAAPHAVEVSSSRGDFSDASRSALLPWTQIVRPDDEHSFIRLPASDREQTALGRLSALKGGLTDLGLCVSTGKVVDFRVRKYLRDDPTRGFPLLYPAHFDAGRIDWPKRSGRKPNALAVTSKRTDLLVPAGVYVVVRRFSAKEERKRIVASLLDPKRLPRDTTQIAVENHLNYYHRDGRGLPLALAKGLVAYLNWTVVDDFFRHFNGHTQVNATDLRSLPYPTREVLTAIGRKVRSRLAAGPKLDAIVATAVDSP